MGVEDAIKKLRDAVVLEKDENKKHIMIAALECWSKTDKEIRMALGFWDYTSG